MASIAGKTSYVYSGFLWTYNFTERYFAELSFGGALNNGLLDGGPGRNAMGCHLSYNPGASIGMHINADWSLLLTGDHISNGKPLLSSCSWNEAANELGLRLSYAFH